MNCNNWKTNDVPRPNIKSLLMRSLGVLFPLAMVLPLSAGIAATDSYPEKPIRLVIPFTPGGASDTSARVITKKMGESMKANFVVENRPGAGGNIAAEIVAKANPDGYTLFWGSGASLTVNPAMGMKLSYNPSTDFAPIGLAVSSCNVLAVRKEFPVSSVRELIALAKARPGQLTYGSSGIGSGQHLCGELFKILTGTDIVHVPYKGSSGLVSSLVGGETDLTFMSVVGMQTVTGRVKALAVSCAQRDPALPDVPSIAEEGVEGYDAPSWYGLLAPARTPVSIIMQLNQELGAALADRNVIQLLERQGLFPRASSPQEFTDRLRTDYARWKRVFSDK